MKTVKSYFFVMCVNGETFSDIWEDTENQTSREVFNDIEHYYRDLYRTTGTLITAFNRV